MWEYVCKNIYVWLNSLFCRVVYISCPDVKKEYEIEEYETVSSRIYFRLIRMLADSVL